MMQEPNKAEVIKPAVNISALNENDPDAIRSIIATMQKGWNARDGQLFASVFDGEHDYIVLNGLYFPGMSRQANARAHQDLFNGIYKDENVEMRTDRIRSLRKDLVQVTVFSSRYLVNAPLPEHPQSIMTILMEKKNHEWKIISFHNHALDSSVQHGPLPMNLMYAGWYQ